MRPSRKAITCGAFSVLLTVVICGFCGGIYLLTGQKRHPNLERLFQGDDTLGLASVVIYGQGQRFEFTDLDSLQYLAIALRSAKNEGYVPKHRSGLLYYAKMELTPAGSVLVGIDTSPIEDGLTVAYPVDGWDEAIHYWVQLPKSMPPAVLTAIEHMRKGRFGVFAQARFL